MFERFTHQARRVVVLAQEEARMLNHNYIGTEHILLGLIHEGEGVAAKSLENLGISLDAVREQVQEIIGQGQQAPSGHIPFTPRAKKVLELSLREALQLGHNYIGTEHILLGLVRETEGVAARVLLDFNANAEKIRDEVIRMLGGPQLRHSAPSEPMAAADDQFPAAMDDVPAAGIDADLGWRGRPMALAALGAAVLARTAFDRSKTGMLEPLQMQLLVRLTLAPPDGTLAEPGELFESLTVALACDRDDLRDAVDVLGDRRLIVCSDEQDGDERLSITAAGVSQVHHWLRQVVPLFGRWPPDHAGADDAV